MSANETTFNDQHSPCSDQRAASIWRYGVDNPVSNVVLSGEDNNFRHQSFYGFANTGFGQKF